MKKYPRRAATLAALIVILTSTLAPLEGRGAPGPMEFWDDPRYLLGDPDIPTNSVINPGWSWISYFKALLLGRCLEPINPQQSVEHARARHE